MATTLTAGDIAFTAAQSDNSGGGANGDFFQFVLLKAVTVGTTIFFTDSGFRTDTSTYRTNETMLRWVAQADLAAGTLVSFTGPGAAGTTPNTAEWTGITPTTGAPTAANASLLLNSGGDNIMALVDPVFGGANGVVATAIAAVTFGGATFAATYTGASGAGGSNNTTALPPELTDGVNAVSIAATDNVKYTGTTSGTVAELRAAINNDVNWTRNADPISPPGVAAITVSGAMPSLSITDVTQAEGDAGATIFTFTVSLSAPAPAGGVTFDIATADGSAIAGSDYVARSLTGQTIAADATSYTFDVTVNGDRTIEPGEAFFVNVTNVTGATVTKGQGTGTLTNDDAAGTFSVADVSVDEGAGTATLTITRTGGAADATIDYATAAGTATAADFTATSGTASFTGGATSVQVIVPILEDALVEGSEAFTFGLANASAGTIGTAAATVTITDNDVAGSVSVADVSVNEDAGTATVTLTRTGGSASFAVDYATANGTATAGADYVATTGTATFGAGVNSVQITVPILDDALTEGNEAFTVALSNPTAGATVTGAAATVTIVDVEAPGSVAIAGASIVEGNAGTQILQLVVTRSGGSGAFAVDFATSNGGNPNNAAATAGSDYVAASGTLNFAAGQNSATVDILISGDTAVELSEELTVTLANATNGASITTASAIGTITNDDAATGTIRIFTEAFNGFTAAGFASTPAAGQLDSDIFRVGGLSDSTNPAYGFTGAAGTDFGRGTIATNDPTTGGVYSPTSNNALVVQPTGTDFEAGGFIEARIPNSAGATANGFNVAFDWVFRNNADRSSALAFSYSTDGTSFTAVPAAAFSTPAALQAGATFTTAPQSVNISGVNVAPNGFLFLRWTHTGSTGSGSRDEVGIDNIIVDAVAGSAAPAVAIADMSVNEAAGTMTFTVTRTNQAAGAFTVDFATSGLTATAGSDYAETSGTLSFGANQVQAFITVPIIDNATPEPNETLRVTLSNPTGGALITTAQATGTIVNDDGGPSVTVSSPSVAEGNAGASVLTFTVTLSEPAPAGGVTFDIATADGSATAASGDYVARSLTGQTIAAGQSSFTFDVTVNGDTAFELAETLLVNVTNITGATVGSAQGTGTIANDDAPGLTLISAVQGNAYFSPILAADGIGAFNQASTTTVSVRAIITAIDTVGSRTGFYITEETADWDGSLGTSEGIFVMVTDDGGANVLGGATVPAGLAVGDQVTVTAKVLEYQRFQNMPVTVLTQASIISKEGSGFALPVLTLDGTHPIPNAILTAVTPNYFDSVDDAGDTFDAATYALSYFETVESMLVRIPNMVVADGFVSTAGGRPFLQAYSTTHANPEQINSRGGYTIAGDPPLSPPDTPGTLDDTRNGGRVLHDGDINPDVIELDFSDFASAPPANLATNASMGDAIGTVSGIVGFDFTDRKLYVTAIEGYDATAVAANQPVREVLNFGAANPPAGFLAQTDARALSVATFNVENLGGNAAQSRFDNIALAIRDNLKLPDILTIEEIQDNNGATAGDGTSATGADASTTWTRLVNALNSSAAAAGSNAVYQWVDQAPVYNSEGGEPNGNIRVGFLYNTTRVQLGDLPANASIEDRRKWTDRIGDNVRDAGDLIQYSDNQAAGINTADWAGTRKSLMGQFSFNGTTVFAMGNHLPSKGGSGEFYQFNQNIESGQPQNRDWDQRSQIGEDLYTLMNLIQTGSPQAGIVAGGDFNDFHFYRPLEATTGHVFANGTVRNDGARLTNLTLTLPEAERYTYTFDGRAQAIDHIIVNSVLAAGASYDVVHINTGYNAAQTTRLSDHDPAVAKFDLSGAAERLSGTAGSETIDGGAGDDILFLQQGGDDTAIGGTGDDGFFFGAAFTSADSVQGGDGTLDQVGLQGSYGAVGAPVVIDPATFTGVELLVLLSGSDTRFGDTAGNRYGYNIKAGDNLVAANDTLRVNFNTLLAGEDVTFDGSAETNGKFITFGGLGVETLTGGAQDDGFFFGSGRFGATDTVNGGGGSDQLGLQGDYSGANAITFGAGQLTSIEFIVLITAADLRFGGGNPNAAYNYAITMNDGNVAGGATLIVTGNTLIATETLTFNGAAEQDGRFTIWGGEGADILIGGRGADTIGSRGGADRITGGEGGDTLTGGDGADTFVYLATTDSRSGAGLFDQILDFASGDKIDLSAIDAITTNAGGTNDAFTFINGAAFSGTAGELRAVNSGGVWTVEGDTDGNGVADLLIQVTTSPSGYPLSGADFIP